MQRCLLSVWPSWECRFWRATHRKPTRPGAIRRNFRVHDLNKMVAQLRERGITVELDSEVYPNERFARLSDPEGNPIQLWQPGGKDPG